MTDAKDNSSLPLLLTVTAAIAVVGVGGWFVLGYGSAAPDASRETQDLSSFVNPASQNEAAEPAEDAVADERPGDNRSAPVTASEVEVALRMARLAADADILLYPETQSAFYYYGQVLDAEPGHAIAAAELDAALSRVEQTVATHLAREEYDAAYGIASIVAKRMPEHPLVVDTEQTLDRYTEQLVQRAIAAAQNGDDDRAGELIATAEALPGRSPEYFTAIHESIAEIREVRLAAEQDRARREQLAAAEAKEAWTEGVRNAIAAGQLVTPAGASARDLLAEENDWDAEREELGQELLAAMHETVQAQIDAQEFDEADALLLAAVEFGGASEPLDGLRDALEAAYIEYESERLIDASSLVLVKSVTPRYPNLAFERNQSGWVEVQFVVTPEGETADVEIMRSEPESVFDRAAIKAIEKWEFEPVRFRGQVISKRAATRLVFEIEPSVASQR